MDKSKAYCVCQHKPFSAIKGNFITCRNQLCPIKWFHLSCLGIDYKTKTYECLICDESDYTKTTMTISRHAIDRLAKQGHFKACCLLCKQMAEDKASSDVDKACAYFFLAHYDFDGVKEQSEHAMTALAMSRYLMDQFPQDDLYSNMVTKLEFILQHVHGNGKEVEGSKGMETGTQDGDPSSRASEGVTSKPMQLQAGGELQDKVNPRKNLPQDLMRLGPANPIDSYLFSPNEGEVMKEPEPETPLKSKGSGKPRKKDAKGELKK